MVAAVSPVANLARSFCLAALTQSVICSVPGQHSVTVDVINRSTEHQAGWIGVSVPFQAHVLWRGDSLVFENSTAAAKSVAWRSLATYRDGSVAVARARLPYSVVATSQQQLVVRVAKGPVGSAPGSMDLDLAESFACPLDLPLVTEWTDPWGRVAVATLHRAARSEPSSSPNIETWRYDGVHVRGSEVGLPVVAWLKRWRGSRRGELTLAIDNGAHTTAAFGPMRLRRFAVRSTDRRLRFRPRFVVENAIEPSLPVLDGDGAPLGYRQVLLGPSDTLYLGDRTAKAFRLDLFWDDEGATTEQRRRAVAVARAPVVALPRLSDVRRTMAFGVHGGPAPWAGRATVDAGVSAIARLLAWRGHAQFGPFGDHGDPADAALGGMPRSGEGVLHDVVRFRSPELLRAAETMVLQHGLRPTLPLPARQPRDLAAYRQGLGPRSLAAPHGFVALDYEHFSVDLLFDYYWLTGDAWARAELVRAGETLRHVLQQLPFSTSRGEGLVLTAGVKIARATGDCSLVDQLRQRFFDLVVPALGPGNVAHAVPQAPHPDAFGETDSFDAPWQLGLLVHGVHALWRETQDPRLVDVARLLAAKMSGPGWVDGVGPKFMVSARDPTQHTMPLLGQPLGGVAKIQLGAFILADEMHRERFGVGLPLALQRAAAIASMSAPPDSLVIGAGSDPWLQVYWDRLR